MGVKVRGKKKYQYRTGSGYCYNKANTRMAKYKIFAMRKPFNLEGIQEATRALKNMGIRIHQGNGG